MDTFGNRFKNLRLYKKYTQEQLINDFNEKFHYTLTKSAISQYENDKRIPEISLLINLASYFEVSIDYLLCVDDIVYEQKTEYSLDNEHIVELNQLVNKILHLFDNNNKITLNGNIISPKTKELFINCIEVALELAQKNENKIK
ncbi:helix-turn-helix domain-containing protein [Clostridium magnum]|uniref:HTH-type transcriptional regulator Xre n=1 Tax=Clostridium magnum DSM 2767 TaxID=1121326 RepID=A0A162QIF8_9CLOT|nr:helix-turn-helix transcriptional regulator [Clostridium magnum]KZL88565.1 HTH-type transcriptional regulator Xre [Clostridium magnum DSM 2767]SHI82709.1 Transcriptional regulator, contains XRE-family HTH domain [Clostridium magnum DSM 2767]